MQLVTWLLVIEKFKIQNKIVGRASVFILIHPVQCLKSNTVELRVRFRSSGMTTCRQTNGCEVSKDYSAFPFQGQEVVVGCFCTTPVRISCLSFDQQARVITGLFISPSGISELDCATTKTDTAERSISIGRESLQVFLY